MKKSYNNQAICQICKNSKESQLCIDCFEKHNIFNRVIKKILELCSIKSNYDEDYDTYINIYLTINLYKFEFPRAIEEKLAHLDRYFYSEADLIQSGQPHIDDSYCEIIENEEPEKQINENDLIESGQTDINDSIQYIETFYF